MSPKASARALLGRANDDESIGCRETKRAGDYPQLDTGYPPIRQAGVIKDCDPLVSGEGRRGASVAAFVALCLTTVPLTQPRARNLIGVEVSNLYPRDHQQVLWGHIASGWADCHHAAAPIWANDVIEKAALMPGAIRRDIVNASGHSWRDEEISTENRESIDPLYWPRAPLENRISYHPKIGFFFSFLVAKPLGFHMCVIFLTSSINGPLIILAPKAGLFPTLRREKIRSRFAPLLL
jgi:hypothetical protein